MLSLKVFLEQQEQLDQIQDNQHRFAIFTTGRMNPPTRGHLRLVENMMSASKQYSADAYLLPTKTYDGFGSTYKSNGVEKVRSRISSSKVKNPLRPDIKLQYIKELMKTPGLIINLEINALSALFTLKDLGYTDLVYVAGGDYFDGEKGDVRFIEQVLPTKADELGLGFAIVNGGDRQSGVPGMSGYKASLAREAALTGDIGDFRARTGWGGEVAQRLFEDVRRGMGVVE